MRSTEFCRDQLHHSQSFRTDAEKCRRAALAGGSHRGAALPTRGYHASASRRRDMMACFASVRKRAFLSQRHDVSRAKKSHENSKGERESATVADKNSCSGVPSAMPEWPDGTIENVDAFNDQFEAADWIAGQSEDWLTRSSSAWISLIGYRELPRGSLVSRWQVFAAADIRGDETLRNQDR
jgi:hypothetical protein